jgi:uncharacterized protein (TIGR00369 family)
MIWQEDARGDFPNPAEFLAHSGFEQLRMFVAGVAPRPPISYLTGMQPTEAGVGSSVFTMPATEWLLPPQGLIYGGPLAILADGPLGTAIQTGLPAATGYSTSELSLNLIRPVLAGGLLVARGRIVHLARNLGLSEVFIYDREGRLVAHGSSRCFLSPLGEFPPPEPLAPWYEPSFDTPHPYERPVEGELLPLETWESMSGLDILRAHIAGDLPGPPINALTGLHPVDASEGSATFEIPCTRWLCSPLGNVEGGVIALAADSALGAAVQTTVPAGGGYASIDLRVNFTRPVPPDGRSLTARARVIHRGRNIAVATAEVQNADGKTVAFAANSTAIVDHPVTAREASSVPDESALQAAMSEGSAT